MSSYQCLYGYGESASHIKQEKSVIGCIEPFEITVFIGLRFPRLECKKGAVGMILADIGYTEP